MAFGDWTMGGLKTRCWFRLQNNPKYTESMRENAAKRAVVRLLLTVQNVSSIYNAETVVLTSGEDAGKYQQEYPLPDNTLYVDSLTFDNQLPLKVLTQEEFVSSNSGTNPWAGDPSGAYYYWSPERKLIVGLSPRPNRVARLQFWGGIEPDWVDETSQATIDASIPPFTEDAADSLLGYMVKILTEDQPGEEARTALADKAWKEERAEFKVNQGVNRVFRTKRVRDLP